MAVQCINRRETVVIYCLLALMFVCVTINSGMHSIIQPPLFGYGIICAKYCFLCVFNQLELLTMDVSILVF